MLQRIIAAGRSSSTSLCFVALLGAGLSAGPAGAQPRQADRELREDAAVCAEFGARYGSPQYTECMLAQQRRRDLRRLEAIERSRMLNELARDSQIMAERARQQRCRRDPDRRECRIRSR